MVKRMLPVNSRVPYPQGVRYPGPLPRVRYSRVRPRSQSSGTGNFLSDLRLKLHNENFKFWINVIENTFKAELYRLRETLVIHLWSDTLEIPTGWRQRIKIQYSEKWEKMVWLPAPKRILRWFQTKSGSPDFGWPYSNISQSKREWIFSVGIRYWWYDKESKCQNFDSCIGIWWLICS